MNKLCIGLILSTILLSASACGGSSGGDVGPAPSNDGGSLADADASPAADAGRDSPPAEDARDAGAEAARDAADTGVTKADECPANDGEARRLVFVVPAEGADLTEKDDLSKDHVPGTAFSVRVKVCVLNDVAALVAVIGLTDSSGDEINTHVQTDGTSRWVERPVYIDSSPGKTIRVGISATAYDPSGTRPFPGMTSTSWSGTSTAKP